MNSFYGGPQGLSFIIARSFSSVAEMVEKFKLGPAYDEVRFDEYVLINTKNKNDPTNGNIYRRGYNYTDDDKLGGALFVGSVVGPAGYTPALEFKSYEEVEKIWKDENYPESKEGWSYRGGSGAYTVATKDSADGKILSGLVPGKTTENGKAIYNDELKWVYCSVRTLNNEECIACLGFKLPYHVPEFIASSVSPYYNRSNQTNNFVNQNLVTRILTENGEDLTKHPYYTKWDIKVPRGIHGQSLENVRVVTATNDINYPTDKTGNKAEDVSKNYQIMVGDYRNYDVEEEGVVTTYYLSDYNVVNGVTLNVDTGNLKISFTHATTSEWNIRWPKTLTVGPDGTITTKYSYGADTTQSKVVKWMNNAEILTGTPEGTGSQKVKITYNTGETAEIGNPLNYIIRTVINPENYHLLVYYADPAKRASSTNKATYDGKTDWTDLGVVKDDSGILIGLNITTAQAGIPTTGGTSAIIAAEKEYLNTYYPNGLQDPTGVNDKRLKGKIVTFGESEDIKKFYAFDYEKNTWFYLGELGDTGISTEVADLVDKLDKKIAELEQKNQDLEKKNDDLTKLVNEKVTALQNADKTLQDAIALLDDWKIKVLKGATPVNVDRTHVDSNGMSYTPGS